MTKFSVARPVTTLMLVLVVFLAGIFAYSSLELAYMPTIDLPVALVNTTYTGTGPKEMEDLITKPIEQTMATLTGVDTITSQSSTGSSMVAVQFIDGTDIDQAVNDMREKLDRVKRTLPDDANEPSIMKIDINAETVDVGITSDSMNSTTLYHLLDDNVTAQFEKIEGVASVSMQGGIEDEIQITVDPNKMSNYGITMTSISQALAAENKDIPGGSLYEGNTELQIRVAGKFNSIEDIKNLYISTNAGNTVLLKDVADVEETPKEQDNVSYINGKQGIMYSLSKQSDANIVTVSDEITKTIENLKQQYPDLEITMMSTTSDYIKTSINNVTSTAFQSAFIAVLVLLFFLRDLRTSLVIGVSIPTSIMATFALMYLRGMTMNIVSMAGIVIGIGMLVDNSVVVLENITVHYNTGKSPKQAAIDGTNEVSMAVFASTLTTIAVFGPMLFITGTVGKMLQDMCYTVCFALIASFFVAVTFVPMACSLILSKKKKKNGKKNILTIIGDFIGNRLNNLDNAYGRVLGAALKHRFIVLVIVFLFMVGTCAAIPNVGMNLMARADEGALSVSASMPSGTSYDETAKMLETMLEDIGDIPELKNMTASASGNMFTGDAISININLVDKEERSRSTDDVVADLQNKLSNIAGADIKVSSGAQAMGSMGGSGFTVKVVGDDSDELQTISDDLIARLKDIPNIENVESSIDSSVPEATITIDRAKASKYGLTASSIASYIYSANAGSTATEFKQDGSEIDVVVKYPDQDINYVKDLNSLNITTPKGTIVPLTEVANINMTDSETTIAREDQHRYVSLTGEIKNLDSNAQQATVKKVMDSYIFPDGYSYEFGGTMEMMNETFQSLMMVFLVAILLVYMIMASQFESFVYPFIVMFSIPLAITGGITGLFFTGVDLSSTGLMGCIMLVGMVVNNAIVLVDYTNQLRGRSGCTCNEALLMAGPSRLRPILMTTLTTVIGLVPMAVAIGSGMETQQAMGIVVIFGLTVSTVITLILIPVLYSIVNSFRRKMNKDVVKFKIKKRNRGIARNE